MLKSVLAGALLCACLGAPVRADCMASFYGREHHGKPTATGARFNMHAMTAAMRKPQPLSSHVNVCRAGRCVNVLVNDRGPAPWTRRCIDLSAAAARAIGITPAMGIGRVTIR